MKKLLALLFFAAVAVQVKAQKLSPTVISTAGNYYTGAGITWSWTLGETIIPTISGGTNMLSQGFQQPEVEILTGTVSTPICAGTTFDLPFSAFGIIGGNNVFTAQLSNSSGSFASPVNIGSITGNTSGLISVTIPPGTTAGSGYRIRVVSNLPDYNGKDNGINITITTQITASISISASESSICAGTSVTFSATANGGATPSYQWKVNGNNVGAGNPTYSTTSLSNNDIVTCVLTANSSCVTGSPATSNQIIMTVTPQAPVTVNITASAQTICAGTSVSFTATPENGGSTPSYQWKVNGNNVGSNSPVYSNSSLNDDDEVTCVMTSSETCVTGSPATSNSVTMNVNPSLPASVSVSASQTTICTGTSVSFTATPTNGGSTPSYQWKVNGNNTGTNSPVFSSSALSDDDEIVCIMTSDATCVTGSPAASNTVTITVNSSVTASVNISSSATTVCEGSPVNFTANPTNGGSTPVYQWKVNGNNAGTNSPVFSSSLLSNNDEVSCVLTSNANCVTGSPATSDLITVTVNSKLPVSVSITSTGSTICLGTPVGFTASPVNGGTTPSYQWKLNGNNVGTNSPTYTNSSLQQDDLITCVMTSSETCITGSPATSNSIEIEVTASVQAFVTISTSQTNICDGAQTDFTASPVNGGTTPSYQWKVNGNNAGTNSSVFTSSSLKNNDIISCVMTSSVTCATGSPASSNTLIVTVTPNVPASVSITASSVSFCPGTKVNFNATPVNGGTTPSYQWKVNGNNAGSNSPSFSSPAFSNDDEVTCVMTSNATCASGSPATSNTVKVNVMAKADAGVVSALRDTVCDGTPASLFVMDNSTGIQWQSASSQGGNYTDISGATNDTYVGLFSSTTFIRAVAGAGGCSDTSNVIKLVVAPSPVAAFNEAINGKTIQFTDKSTGATVYHWEFGDGATDNTPSPSHTYADNGTYHVCLTVYNGSNCSFTICKDLNVGVSGVATIEIGNSWTIYPNPLSNNLFISSNENIHSCTLEVYDVLGRLQMNFENMQLQKTPASVNLSSLSQGMYLLKIKTEKADYVHRIIKM